MTARQSAEKKVMIAADPGMLTGLPLRNRRRVVIAAKFGFGFQNNGNSARKDWPSPQLLNIAKPF